MRTSCPSMDRISAASSFAISAEPFGLTLSLATKDELSDWSVTRATRCQCWHQDGGRWLRSCPATATKNRKTATTDRMNRMGRITARALSLIHYGSGEG